MLDFFFPITVAVDFPFAGLIKMGYGKNFPLVGKGNG